MTFIGDLPLIVSQSRRALYELNQIAGYIGCRLEDGVALPQLAQEMADRGVTNASGMLEGVLADWCHAGLVRVIAAPPVSAPLLVQSVTLGGRAITIYYHDDALSRHVAPLFTHLESRHEPGLPATSYHLWQHDNLCLFSKDGGDAAVLKHNQAATLVKARMVQDIIDDPCWSLALHAGCVSRGGRAMLLTGPPGAGKTTLISWLIGSGFAYHGDDISMMRPDGRVVGLPFLPSVKSGAWPMMSARYPGQLHPLIHWRPDGRRVRYLSTPPPAGQGALPVGWIVKLRRTKGARARLIEQPSAALVQHLLSEAASSSGEADRAAIDTLIRAVSQARTWEMEYEDLDDAATLLGGLCDAA